MASRLQPDESKGQANWADIDDDDDDWAPDTITWKDGTKVSITHTDEPQPPQPPPPEPASRQPAKEITPAEKAKSPAPGTSPSVKPGVLASGKGLVLKGAPEKPTLVAKPPAPPAPAKSPWAPLPKVDKVSPIAVDVSSQPSAKSTPKDAAVPKVNTPPPPKEIAADDFSRAPWRDGAPAGNKELFNSQSGRYEPVTDRRGSLRPEPQHGRQPALLQRPPHHEQQGPVEPSGAFQTGRSNEQQGIYGRRRGSSNVSGGSGSWQRLRGLEHPLPPPELINARRGSTAGRSDSPASPRNFSPSDLPGASHQGQGWQPRVSPGTVHATPNPQGAQAPMPPPAHQPTAAPVTEQDYELQKKLMRERRELAMRRRQEEEAREEAARRERIRLKLEALGPPPEPKSAKVASARDQIATPTQIQSRDSLASQDQPPEEAHGQEQAKGQEQTSQTSGLPESSRRPATLTNGVEKESLPPPEGAESRQQPPGSSHAHPWPTAAKSDRYPASSWGPQPSTKIWGAPNNNNRSLGNGTFVSDISTSQLPQIANKSGPGPIAPPNGSRSASASQSTVAVPATRQPPIGPPRQPRSDQSTGDRDTKENPWAAAVRRNDEKFSEMLNAQYEGRDRRLQEDRSLTDMQPAIKDTWLPTKLDEKGIRTEAATKQTVQIGQEKLWTASADSKSATSQQPPSAPSAAGTDYSQLTQSTAPHDISSASILSGKASAPQQARGSRFFPSRDTRQEVTTEAQRPKSPSPPPPDMAGHPAFDGDATHPHVSLPRPQPVVRLPPSVARESQSSAPDSHSARVPPSRPRAPSFSWATQAAYKEHDNAPRVAVNKPDNAWQTRIDNLLSGRKTNVPLKPAGSDSRSAPRIAEPPLPLPALLPSGRDESITTKGMAEECFEEQEMGSVPPVRIPTIIPETAWQICPSPQPLPKKLYAVVSSADPITFPVDVSGAGTVWHVSLPGSESKRIIIPFGRARSNPRRGGQRGSRHPTGPPHRQGKGRDASTSYPGDQGSGGSGSNPSRNHRGSYRGRDNWPRNSTAKIQT
jgi:hypothetical protein